MNIAPFKLERYFAQYEVDAPYLLCCSDCESTSVQELLSMEPGSSSALGDLRLGYTESRGNPLLRTEIASLYDRIHPDQVLVHSGAEEAITGFMNAVLQEGDHVIVHWPCYQSLSEVAKSIGCTVTKWVTREADNWALDTGFLKDSIRTNTKAVVINCPHNPTGYLMSRAQLAEIDRLSKEHGFIVFSDEVYRYLEYSKADLLPPFCDLNKDAVSLGVMSKSFGLAGLRIGWIATRNRSAYDRMAAYKDYTTICNSAPSEYLATLALKHRERIIARNRQIVLDNLKVLDAFFAEHQDRFSWRPPRAGPIAFPSLRTDEQIESFCHRLRTQAGVLLLPGTVYGSEYDRNFRIGFGRQNLPECVERLDTLLKRTI